MTFQNFCILLNTFTCNLAPTFKLWCSFACLRLTLLQNCIKIHSNLNYMYTKCKNLSKHILTRFSVPSIQPNDRPTALCQTVHPFICEVCHSYYLHWASPSSGIGECVWSKAAISNIDPFLEAPRDGALLLLIPVPPATELVSDTASASKQNIKCTLIFSIWLHPYNTTTNFSFYYDVFPSILGSSSQVLVKPRNTV